jgi:RHS repeat-associated protein
MPVCRDDHKTLSRYTTDAFILKRTSILRSLHKRITIPKQIPIFGQLIYSQTYYKNCSRNSHLSHPTFGMQISERSETFTSNSYRFGFNGKEQDNEVSGSGNSYDFGARIYDSRLGRWMSTDPLWKLYPEMSDYSFALNSPLVFIDEDGKKVIVGTKGDEKDDRQPVLRTINSAFNGKVIASVANELKGYIKIELAEGVTKDDLSKEELATFELLNNMMLNDERYTIFSGKTNQRGYSSQEDYFDKTIFEANMQETPSYKEDGSNPFNQLYSLYHFFAEQKLKEENFESKFIDSRQAANEKDIKLKNKQCTATTREQTSVFGYSIDESTIEITGDITSVGFVNTKGNLIGTLKSNTSTGEYSFEANRMTESGDYQIGPVQEDGTF